MVRTYDTQHQVYYAPSFQEQKALEAVSRGDEKTAKLWYVRAIMADPTRGTRVFSQCSQLDSPLMNTHSGFVVRPGNESKERFRCDLFRVCVRLTKDCKDAEVYTDELMSDLRFWDEPIAQTSKETALPKKRVSN
ncbi:MAG: hypothetical protein EOO38_03055 [Cytophagaceae bacterium]|nr:MAG: hypothetical protein EOO38_03055 [Cytophagaceae bacterium]